MVRIRRVPGAGAAAGLSFAAIGAFALTTVTSSIEQTSQGTKPQIPLLVTFDGLGVGMRPGPGTNNPPAPRNPSDNSLAVGRDRIVQIVNSQMAVFDKQGRTLWGPVSTNAIFAGFGGVCEARPNGDAVVRYDQLADRWLIVTPIFRRTVFDEDRSQAGAPAAPGEPARAVTGRPGPPPPLPPQSSGQSSAPQSAEGSFAMCYAVSVTDDPLGPYHRYAFERPLYPDYPRPAVWPDGYYVATSSGDDVIEKHACVVERAKMLSGQPAREQCRIVEGANFLNSADLDGRTLPPPGAPNVMMAAGGTQLKNIFEDDAIYAWTFHVDWEHPAKTRIDGPVRIAVAPYHYLCDGQLSNCVPQPGITRRLDAQGDKIMQRLVYRNVDGRESIVAVHSIGTSAGGGGVRWYEFRLNKQRDPVLYQQSTFAPDNLYRWLGSMAMDKKGNIGLAYSFGGDPNYPGQRFTARQAKDPKGQFTFQESVLAEGKAAQNGSLRWEDYTNIVVDPSDDCTFWFVGNYLKPGATTSTTRIGSFVAPGCK